MTTAADVSSQLDSIPSMVVLILFDVSQFSECSAKLILFFERCKSVFLYLIGEKPSFFINFVCRSCMPED